jgi:hypothetical protein
MAPSPSDREDSRRETLSGDVRRRVLVVGTDDWAIEQAVAGLTAAGHQALTCHPLGQPAFPCNALVEGRVCPLDAGFDVVVTMRARPLEAPAAGELGVVCGLHAGAALVTAGMGVRNPFARWADRSVGTGNNLADVVAEVAAARDLATVALEVELTDPAAELAEPSPPARD